MSNQNIDLNFIQTFLACIGNVVATPSQHTINDVVHDLILHPSALNSVKNFFTTKYGWDSALVTKERLRAAAVAMGFIETPIRSFGDMLACIKQHQEGLISDDELIVALQCTSIQIQAVLAHQNLPLKIHRASSLADWDDFVQTRHAKADTTQITAYTDPTIAVEKPNVRDISFVATGHYVHHTLTQRCLFVVAIPSMNSELSLVDKVRVVPGVSNPGGNPTNYLVPISDLEPVPPANQRLRYHQRVLCFDHELGVPAEGHHFEVLAFDPNNDPETELVSLVEVCTATGVRTQRGGWTRAVYVQPDEDGGFWPRPQMKTTTK